MSLPDEDARRRIQEDLDSTLVVEAAAGTGKTTALVSRLVSLLRTGRATLDRIVAVTFTEKAAGEMKLRLREGVEDARDGLPVAADERRRLDEALAQFEVARIATIHAFAADLLRERPVEAQIDPEFEMAGEEAAHRLLDEAFDVWFQGILEDPPEGVRRLLRRRPRGRDADPPREKLRKAAWSLTLHRDFARPWRRDAFDRKGEVDTVFERLAAVGKLVELAEREEDYLAQSLATIDLFVKETRRREAALGYRDYDGLAAELAAMRRERHWTRWKGSPWRFGAKHAATLAARDEVRAQLDAFVSADDADLASCLQHELRAVVAAYEDLKLKMGRLDFLDLLLRARNLIRDHADVRAELQRRFTHILVDEFQDTDPLQAEILLLLAADEPGESDWKKTRPVSGKLFVVGDPKQSIYRFRRADVALYDIVKKALIGQGAALVNLSTSFRAVPSLQSAVNAAFAPVMRGSADGQPDYVPLQAWREGVEGQPTVVVLPVPRPYSYREVARWAIDESLPDAVGALVEWLISESGWTVTERANPERRVRIEARHICILFRAFQSWGDATRPYVRALEARRVPHVLVGGRAFHEREEVLAIRNALQAIERPSDELAVFGTLRGPLFALSDDALLAFRHQVGRPHPLRQLDLQTLSPGPRDVAEALAVLRDLHLERNHRPIAETISRLLAETRAHAGIAIWPAGEQALANVLRVMDLARRYEAAGATSFRAFVDHLAEQADSGAAADAPVVEEGTEGVRIMTVHKAKGLEFPVVILADLTTPAVWDKPSRHVDQEKGLWVESLCGCAPPELIENADVELQRDSEEAIRLAYVAATRARDLLVVPAVGDEEIPSWVETLYPIIYPVDKRSPADAPGCPAFGDDSVVERPDDCPRSARDSVAPGLHKARSGGHEVVWWDPRVLALGKDQVLGLRQQKLLQADEAGVSGEGEKAHAAWRAGRESAITAASQARLLVRRVTDVTALAAHGPEQVGLERTTADRTGRPSGRRFGALVHGMLAAVDLTKPDRENVRRLAIAHGRMVGASNEEVAAAIEVTCAAVAHPLLRRAAASAEKLRETPLVLRLPDGTLAEGTLDLAFREADEWTIVDFKTDSELEGSRPRYEGQVRLYARAVGEATGKQTRGAILII